MLTNKELEEIAIMKQAGVFDYSGGVAFIYRDVHGDLKAIKIEINSFRKGKILMKPEMIKWMNEIKVDNKNSECII